MGHLRGDQSEQCPMSPCARKLQLVQDSYIAGEIDESEKGQLKRQIIGQALKDEGMGANPMDAVMNSDEEDHEIDATDDDGDDDLSDCDQADAEDADEALQEREDQLRAELSVTQQRCADIRQQLQHARQLQYVEDEYDDTDSESDED